MTGVISGGSHDLPADAEDVAQRAGSVHIWAGGDAVLCNTQHPLVTVRFDCLSLFSPEALCPRCVAAWK